jgi:RNA polymerase sigma-70 factor (ECF subfamily)
VSAVLVRPQARTPARSDRELLALVADGDLGALGELYDRYARDVWRVARRLLGSDADAEDVLHAVFLKLPQIASSHDGRSNVRAWLIGICVRLSARHRRTAARFFNMISSFAQVVSTTSRSDPEREMSNREELQQLESALSNLAPKKRIAFMLVELEGLTSDEAARALDVPAATIRTRLHHARRELDAALNHRVTEDKGGSHD